MDTIPDASGDYRGIRSTAEASSAAIAGRYLYRRTFHDERPLELRADGTIGDGAAGMETHWRFDSTDLPGVLQILGNRGLTCELRQDRDDVWRGRWRQFEKMLIELYPEHCPAPPLPRPTMILPMDRSRFHFVSYAQFLKDIQEFAQKLPPLRAVVGVPRGGMLPATVIALHQNVPLLPLDEVLYSANPRIPFTRRRTEESLPAREPILVVDETVASGRQFAYLKSRVKANVQWAAIYVREESTRFVDYFHSLHLPVEQSYEWTLFHDDKTCRSLCDLDGVLCEDWQGDEEADPAAYLDHVANARPLRVCTEPLMGIVTGRLEKYRDATEQWLARHGIRYGSLHMFNAASVAERSAFGIPEFKSKIYAGYPQSVVFIESCPHQSQRIHELTCRPVLDHSRMVLLTNH